MIEIFATEGFIYTDFKPDNVGMLEGDMVILDAGNAHFFKVDDPLSLLIAKDITKFIVLVTSGQTYHIEDVKEYFHPSNSYEKLLLWDFTTSEKSHLNGLNVFTAKDNPHIYVEPDIRTPHEMLKHYITKTPKFYTPNMIRKYIPNLILDEKVINTERKNQAMRESPETYKNPESRKEYLERLEKIYADQKEKEKGKRNLSPNRNNGNRNPLKYSQKNTLPNSTTNNKSEKRQKLCCNTNKKTKKNYGCIMC
jgi:hypothetical protein